MKRTIRVLMSVIMVSTMVLVACGANVKAIGGANEGSSPSGGGCSGGYDAIWWDTCFGYSWQAYRVTKDLPSSNYVTFHYTDNTGGPTYLHYCKKGQIIYNYGFEVYNGSFYENDGVAPIQSYGTQVSTQLDKDGTQARWRAGGALGAYDGVNNTTSNYLTSEGYATAEIVKKKYDEMVKYDREHGTDYAHGTTWDTVGYFCWSDFTIKVNATEGQYDGGSFKPVYEGEKIKVIQSDIISSVTAGGKDVVLDVNNYSDPSGYTWVQWGTGGACKGQSKRCVIANAESGETLNAYYVRNKFEGQATVNGGGSSASTGFVGKEGDGYDWAETRTIKLSNCPTSGCEVNFSFGLKKTAGNGTTTYNLWRSTDESSTGEQVTDSPKWSDGAIPSRTEKIKSGETVCWRMSFYAVAAVSKPSSDGAKIGRVKICAEAEGGEQPDGFSGKIEVFGPDGRMSSDDDRYTVIDRRREYTIDNCSSDGCIVRFGHYVLASGSGSTSYEVNRSSNLEEKVGKHRESGKTSGGRVYADTVTMYPGMRVCEELRFLPDPAQTSHYTVINACVVAAGTADSDISIEVKNDSIIKYNDWRFSSVYAKPGDTVSFKGTYTPSYQYAYNLTADSVKITQGVGDEERSVAVERDWSMGSSLGNMFDKVDERGWFNAFSVDLYSNNRRKTEESRVYQRDNGENESYGGGTDGYVQYEVLQDDVGEASLYARAETNRSDWNSENDETQRTQTTPEKVVFGYSDSESGKLIDANIYVNSKSAKVSVLVPYNFINTTSVTSNPDEVQVQAGQSVEIKFDYSINPRSNELTTDSLDEKYATSVDFAMGKLKYCSGAECSEESGGYIDIVNSGGGLTTVGNVSGTYLEESETNTGKTISNLFRTIKIPEELEAGTKFCVKSSVYPKDSGSSDNFHSNYYNPDDGDSWADAERGVCFVVGKRPNFQVWGGSVYSAGDLKLAQTTKNIGGESYVFGSWTELGLVAKGKVEGLASGAGLGYGDTGDAKSVSQGGGVSDIGGVESEGYNYCVVSTLSFLNNQCKDVDEVGDGVDGFVGKAFDAKAIDFEVDVNENEWLISDDDSLFGLSNEIGDVENAGSVMYGDGSQASDKILWKKNGDIKINKNLIRKAGGGGYNRWNDVGKFIIYSDNGDIKISCKVDRIDAILIAKRGKVDTCSDVSDENSKYRSRKLLINGSVIAGTLTLGRTYGAASGVNAVVPAEIINYDTSLYSWASNRSSSTNQEGLVEAYTAEMAPRY